MDRTWDQEIAELQRRREKARQHGGEPRVARERAKNRLTARERIDLLLDEGSFQEVGMLATMKTADGDLPSSLVCGFGRVDGRPVAVGAEDYTIAMGIWTGSYLDKSKGVFPGYIEDLAYQWELPLVLFLQSIGGDVDSPGDANMNVMPSAISMFPILNLLSRVPMVTAVMGPTAGGSAARAVCSHFSLMSRPSGLLFGGGPPLVEHALGQKVDKHDLGGYQLHTRESGAIDNAFDTEEQAVDSIRRFLSYLPGNVNELPPRHEPHEYDSPDRECDELLKVLDPSKPRRVYDPRDLIADIFDRDSFFEIGPDWGKSIVTGLARLGGMTVGILAHHGLHAGGALTPAAADKQARFVEMCDTFHVPIVYLIDTPGIMVGVEAERTGVLRRCVRAMAAIHRASVPVVSLHVRRTFGLGTMAAGSPDRLSIKLAWPSVTQGAMGLPIEAAAATLYKEELAKAEDPEALLREIVDRQQAEISIWKAGESFSVEDIIDPRETRRVIYRWLETAVSSLRPGPKHGPQYRP